MELIKRWAEGEYAIAKDIFKTILFAGVRQCGKTTLMKASMPADAAYVSMDNVALQQQAAEAPGMFLLRYRAKPCIVIDEVQKVPDLFHEIKRFADEKEGFCQFLLSGSSDCRAMPAVHESLAGRLGEVRLRPLTEGEIQGNPPRLLQRLEKNDFSETVAFEECHKAVILEKAIAGGFPVPLRAESIHRRYWYDDYVNALVRKDFLEIADFKKPDVLHKLLQLSAIHSSRSINMTEVATLLGVSRPTLMQYMAALETMYLVNQVPAWMPRGTDKVLSKPKLLLCDTGLMSYLAGVGSKEPLAVLEDKDKTDLVGNLVETWVYQQLAPLTDIGRDWKIYHYRDSRGREIDFLLENMEGDLICFEVKASEGVKSEHFKHLRWFREQYGKGRRIKTVLLYCGMEVLQYAENEWALPMAYLWK